ncbi:hypothetical protein AC579_3025 [Pseudocercospora musae]|uniref:F-box domain-containing protein n=1 Tax=Pseudocercospora musae TaxID=113226 RepID=A0A139HC19_9PEZI|nr:hypothetical protein AC579_3025 [Pseudocercospora musae]
MPNASRGRQRISARRALYRQQDLEQRLATLINHAEHDAPGLKSALQLVQTDAAVISKFFSDHMDARFYNERRPPYATDIAVRAFAIPEVLEMILDELDHNELLGSQLVNRQFRDTIKASPNLRYRILPPRSKVRKRIGPRINIDGNVNGVNLTRECRHCKLERQYDEERVHRHCTKEVRADVEDRERMIPWRCLDMQICEPPIYDMKIWITCRCVPVYDADWEPDPFDQVSNEHGITLRDLLDKAQTLRADHTICKQTPHGHPKAVDWTPDDITVIFGGDHEVICKKCSDNKFSWQVCLNPHTPSHPHDSDIDSEADSDDDTYTDGEDDEYNARLLTNKKGRQ